MKISDEIREWCNINCGDFIEKLDCDELRELADHIDSEMVELPLSADGKIWTGREVCFWTDATNKGWHKFEGLYYTNGRWYVEDDNWKKYPAVSVWGERSDSFERIADELDEQAGSLTKDGYTWQEDAIHDFADRIRKLAAKED